MRYQSGFPPLNSNEDPALRAAAGAGVLRQIPILAKQAQSTGGKIEQSCGRDETQNAIKNAGGVKYGTTFLQGLSRPCGSSVSWYKPETSLLYILFSSLEERHASGSSLLLSLISDVIVDMKLYQATTNIPCTVVPPGQTIGMRRIPITRTRTILSIGVPVYPGGVREEEKVHRNSEANRNGGRNIQKRLLLCESREGLNIDLLTAYMTEESWKELVQDWGSPDASWQAHPSR